MKNDKIVEVVWHDAHASEQWHLVRDIPDRPIKVRSVGYFHKRTSKALVLLTSRTEDGAASFLVIPAKWVKSIREITHVEGQS